MNGKFGLPMLDTAVKAVKVRDSDEYSPVVWDKGLYGEGINVAVLDTGVDNERKNFWSIRRPRR